MDITNEIIAKLVFSYLRTVNCYNASKEFLRTSPDLQELKSSIIKNNQYFISRLFGLNLTDIINEYAAIYNLVQGRLEATNFYNDVHPKSTLVEQLEFLLENARELKIRTPISLSRCSTPLRKADDKQFQYSPNCTIVPNINGIENVSATPFKNIEGFLTEERNDSINSPIAQVDISPTCNISVHQKEILTQTMLEHQALIEKLAENINLVRSSDEVNTETEKTKETLNATAGNELDRRIKTIIQKTEENPMFEELLTEIIGNTEDGILFGKDSNTNNTQPSTTQILTKTDASNLLQEITKRKPTNVHENIIEGQNNDAIQSIITASKSNITQSFEPVKKQMNENNTKMKDNEMYNINLNNSLNINTDSTDVIMYNGTLDNFIQNSNVNQQPVLVNQSGLLMVQPSINRINLSKPCYIISGSQLVPLAQPQCSSVISEHDIMTMPTVIVNQSGPSEQPAILPCPATEKHRRIIPKSIQNKTEIIKNDNLMGESKQKLLMKTKVQISNSNEKQTHKNIPPSKTIAHFQSYILRPAGKIDKNLLSNLPPHKNLNEKSTDTTQNKNLYSPKAPTTPDGQTQIIKRTTPKSGSHIRHLDFNVSSSKCKINKNDKVLKEITTPCTFQSISQGEIKKGKGIKISSWDADLRALTGSSEDKTPSPKKNRKRNKIVGSSKKNQVSKLNKTELDANQIEAALLNTTPENMHVETNDVTSDEKVISACNIDIKSSSKENNFNKTNSKESKSSLACNEVIADTLNVELIVKDESDIPIALSNDHEHLNIIPESQFGLININSKPRYRKKCNIDNSVKKEMRLTKVKEVKVLDIVTDGNNKLILSPSKLNANKRSLVDDKETIAPCLHDATKGTVEEGINIGRFVTPETIKVVNTQQITSKCNITPMLETPVKIDQIIPKTPGLFSPLNTVDTPFTRVFKEQIQGIDLASIQTPKFPLTPNFPITPLQGESAYSNRPTDYSTSSSYYQPSDNEQNKSLEQQILDECKRLESKTSPTKQCSEDKEVKLLKELENTNVICDTSNIHSRIKSISEQFKSNSREKDDLQNVKEMNTEPPPKGFAERIKTLQRNVIAKKDLKLLKTTTENMSNTSNLSNSTDDSCESNDSNYSCWSGTMENNKTITDKQNVISGTRYSLRPRLQSSLNSSEENHTSKSIQNIINNINVKDTLKIADSQVSNCHGKILQEMEDKRKRTVERIKDPQSAQNEMFKSTETRKPTSKKRNSPLSDESNRKISLRKRKETISKSTVKLKPKKPNESRRKSPKSLFSKSITIGCAKGSDEKYNYLEIEKKNSCKYPNKQKSNPTKLEMDKTSRKNPKFTSKNIDKSVSHLEPCISTDVPIKKQHISERKSIDESENEILFHLSSDDEIVENNEIINLKSPSCTENTEENKHTETTSGACSAVEKHEKEQEAENLVKGLHMRGIHLVHKKSSDANVNTLQKDSEVCISMSNTDIENCNKTDTSLEDGEIVSDDEEKHIPMKKRKIKNEVGINKINKNAYLRHLHLESKPTNRRHNYKDTALNNQNKSQYELTHKEKCDITRNSQKYSNFKHHPKKGLNTNTHELINVKTSIDISNVKHNCREFTSNIIEERWNHFQTITNYGETHTCFHDENKVETRNFSNYDLSVLQKKINLWADIDNKPIEKCLTITDFSIILDISFKQNVQMKTSKQENIEAITSKLLKPKTQDKHMSGKHIVSPLDNLYLPKAISYDKKEFKLLDSSATSYGKHIKKMSPKKIQSGSKSELPLQEKFDDEMICTSNVNIEQSDAYKEKETYDISVRPMKSLVSMTDSVIESPKTNIETKNDEKKVCPDIKCSSSADISSGKNISTYDLMDLALGIESPEKLKMESTKERGSVKRKAINDDTEDVKPPSKKSNMEELFKKVDVDSFLKKLHGEK